MPDRRLRVALLIETSNRYGRDLLHGVHDWVAAHADWSMRLTEQSRHARLPDWLREWDGDGVIARVDSAAAAATLRARPFPVVDVSAERPRSEFPRVGIDNVAVARAAFEHLQAKKIPHLAYCGDPRFLWSRERGRAFLDLLRRAGRKGAAHALTRAHPAESEEGMRELTAWIAALPKPVGIFACYDRRAQQVLTACQQLNLAVPGEVAVLGVDNDEVICELCDPPLSSVLPNARRAGYEAAEILHRMMSRPRVRPSVSLEIEPVRVVERLSTDVVGVPDPTVAAAVRHIRTHASDGINVADVLRAFPMSRTLLERKFRRWLGCSPHHLIKSARVERAKELLAETSLPIARVADLAGFESPSYLSAAFRHAVGESPRAYRQRHAGR
jgi:LacI family transcriptional regulator